MARREIIYHNGDVYNGEVDDEGRPHGKGKYTHERKPNDAQRGRYFGQHPDAFEGDWRHGEKHGEGIHEYTNGDRYEGHWRGGRRDDTDGEYTYHNNPRAKMSEKYDGSWQENNKHGMGTMVFTNGDRYVGRWVNGVMETLPGETATYTFNDGSQYVGEWRNGKREGNGKLTYTNGDRYEGGFKDDVREGTGTYTYANNEIYQGGYQKNRRHGSGTFTYADPSKCFTVKYSDDELIRSSPQP